MPLGCHAALELLCSSASTHKDDRGSLCHEAIELQQCLVLVGVISDVDVKLLDTLDGQVVVREGQRVGLRRKTLGVCDDVSGERSREQHRLTVLRKHSEVVSDYKSNLAHRYSRLSTSALLAQTLLVKHVVGLIEDEDLDALGVNKTPPQHICDGAWCANKNMRIKLLATPGRIRDDSHCLKTLHELSHVCDDAQDLTCKLSAGREYQRLRLHLREVDARQAIERECGCLSSTGLRLRNHVCGRVHEQQRQSFLLNLRWLAEVHGADALEKVFRSALISILTMQVRHS